MLKVTVGRPTNATDSVSLVRAWLYNRRSELAAASIGTNLYGYAYDTIGNRLWSSANSTTNAYTANNLNQYTSVAGSTNLVYDADGNLTNDGFFSYSYDAENRLVAAYPLSDQTGHIALQTIAYQRQNAGQPAQGAQHVCGAAVAAADLADVLYAEDLGDQHPRGYAAQKVTDNPCQYDFPHHVVSPPMR